ncbi:MAG TPA: anaerobic glycerol-3-phosphate dehydrogenase subunit C [Candidatus Limnocylindrales bacterium]|nr:anaerobic glycerol-3-phosphate dehydrogenase subunit C [Candidatus Limnocylindrales bacterium]
MTIADLVREASAELDHHVSSSADECLKCNVCNTVCPVMRVTDLFPGPKYEGPQAQRFRLARGQQIQGPFSSLVPSPDHSVDYCSGCGWCTTACPAGVKIAEMNNQARARLREGRRPKLRDWGLGQTDLTGSLGTTFSPIANAVMGNGLARAAMEAAVGIHRKAPVPKFARTRFQQTWRKGGGETGAHLDRLPGPDKAVVYFHGCAANYYEPHVAQAAIEVLKRNGLETIVPQQVCCGLPLISNGLYDDARERACSNTKVLAEFARRGYRIVGTSTSCTHTLKAEYEEMLDLHDDDTKVVAQATWDICELLLDLHDHGRLNTDFGALDEDLPYHAPCQLRSHGIGLPALDLFALVPGLRARDMDHDCCGIAGTYGLKKEKYGIAMKVGAPLFEKVKASGATTAACDSETCRWQIETATGVRTRHPVEILLDAYRAGDAARG